MMMSIHLLIQRTNIKTRTVKLDLSSSVTSRLERHFWVCFVEFLMPEAIPKFTIVSEDLIAHVQCKDFALEMFQKGTDVILRGFD